MRKIIVHESVLTAVFAMTVLLMLQFPIRSQTWIYPLVRYVAQVKMNFVARSMAVYETEHFIIKYEKQDADVILLVAQAAEKAYQPVVRELGYTPHGKTMIFIYPDKQQLNQAFGWSGDQSAMGVYWGGAIQILSPKAWLSEVNAEEFIRSGPMVHEFTHLVFDYMTSGNYSRWFTEGLAQYVEYKVNGYEWKTDSNSLNRDLYTMEELDKNFDKLSNQALAYRESLMAIRYIGEVYGEAKLGEVINNLRKGQSLSSAIREALNMDYADFETSWQNWAKINVEHEK
ncbi:MAG: hypothetical protein H6Q73_1575 [Firmicutes bacterium]|nr:hypothetical protein [Bacillota bacterium]